MDSREILAATTRLIGARPGELEVDTHIVVTTRYLERGTPTRGANAIASVGARKPDGVSWPSELYVDQERDEPLHGAPLRSVSTRAASQKRSASAAARCWSS